MGMCGKIPRCDGVQSSQARRGLRGADELAVAGVNSHQAFLGGRSNQLASLIVNKPAIETAGAAGAGAVLVVKQPFVGAKRSMKPHGMVEARDLHVVLHEAHSMPMPG